MSNAINRARARQQYRRHENAMQVLGEDKGSSDASAYGNLIATLAQAGGEIASTQMKKQEAEKQAAADKAAQLKRENDTKDADLAAENARRIATGKMQEAQLASLKAGAEKEPYGPLHVAAQNAKNAADMADADARRLEAKAASLHAGMPGSPESMQALQVQAKNQKSSGEMPLWAKIGLGALGVGGVGFVSYKLFKRKGK